MPVTIAAITSTSKGLADRYNVPREDLLQTRLSMAEERARLIGEVHDSIGSRITAALLHHREGSREKVGEILQVALENARDFTAVLKLSNRLGQNLASEIREFVATYSDIQSLKLDLSIAPDLSELSLRTRLNVLRIFQEWITNCIRHGQARSFRIECLSRDDALLLRIQSDGRPFAYDSHARGSETGAGGSGLNNIRMRCNTLGGRARARLDRNKMGSVFVLQVPIA